MYIVVSVYCSYISPIPSIIPRIVLLVSSPPHFLPKSDQIRSISSMIPLSYFLYRERTAVDGGGVTTAVTAPSLNSILQPLRIVPPPPHRLIDQMIEHGIFPHQ